MVSVAGVLWCNAGTSSGQTVASTHLVDQAPVSITRSSPDTFLVDFGRVAFGNVSLSPMPGTTPTTVTVRYGEALNAGRVDTHPPGSVRYTAVKV